MTDIRVDNFVFPQIYEKFQAKDRNSEQLVNYIIQDLPENRFQEAVQFMVDYFIPDEAQCEYKKLADNPPSVQNAIEFWGKVLNEKVSLVCFKENSDEIIAINILTIFTRKTTLDDYGVTDQLWKEIFSIGRLTRQKFNYFDHHNVDKMLKGFGLGVKPDYRGRGIATQMLKARLPLMRTFKDVNVTANGFSSNGSVLAAKRAGYEEHLTIRYSDMQSLDPEFNFPGMKHKCYTAMSLRLN